MIRFWLVLAGVGALVVLIGAGSAWPGNVLTWVDNSGNEANFHIERKPEACGLSGLLFAEIATTGSNIRTFNDQQVMEGDTYCYRVAASNPAGKSGYTNEAGRTVPFSVPAAPSGLGVSGGP